MADSVTTQSATLATVPASTKIATDEDATNGHVQIIKLAISTDGSATVIPADAANGLDVDVTRVSGTVTVGDGGSTLSVDDGAGSLTVDVGTALPAGTNTIGAVNVKPATSGGLSTFRSIDLDETEEAVKASAGQLFGWYIYNDGAAEVYLKLYNDTVANVVVGTTTPSHTFPIPAGAAANVEFTNGIAFSTAITAAATTGVADNDTGAPATNQVVANLFYA